MSFSISVKKFRNTVDQIKSPRDSALIKMCYLLASRNSEICSETAPFDLLRNASKPYGTFLKYEMKDFVIPPADDKAKPVTQKVLVITSAVAKRGKQLKHKDDNKKPTEVTQAEVVEAFTKFGQMDLLDKVQSGELKVDPLLIKVLLGKIFLKIVALPISMSYEPWTYDILRHIQRNKGSLSFPMTRQRLWQVLRAKIPKLLPRKDVHNVKNPLRHFRISHLIEYYDFDPVELTTYAGWTVRSTFGQMGIAASPNIDHYAHLRWRKYFPKLLKPIADITK